MDLYPAIDIRGGKCVRLRQGDYGRETVFDDDPFNAARRWVDEGATRLHLVDLDGARSGTLANESTIAVIARLQGVECQLGGGIRTTDAVRRVLDLGLSRAIIGTQALRDPDWFAEVAMQFPGRILLGLDARDGFVATDGWLATSRATVRDVLRRVDGLPLAGVIYTDIAKDGMMSGPSLRSTVEVQSQSSHTVIASGGIATEEDVRELNRAGIRGCILGRCIYEGTVSLPSLIKYFETVRSNGAGRNERSGNQV